MKTYTATLQGLANLFARHPCEDASASSTQGSIRSVCIADGASCCAHAGETSHAIAEACSAFLVQHFDQLYNLPDRLVRAKVLALIRSVQQELVDHLSCAVGDCGSTLIAIAADRTRWLALQLGDGTVITRMSNGDCVQLLKPDKGESAHATYLTVHADDVILEHLRVLRGRGGSAFLATSDGLEGLIYAPDGTVSNDAAAMLSLAESNHGDEIITTIRDSAYRPDDDVSVAIILR